MLLLIAIALLVGTPATAKAYIDPGSGSFMIQMIIAAVVGLGYTLKMYWSALFRRGNESNEAEDLDD